MNEFQRKLMDAIQYSSYIASFADPSRTILAIANYSYAVDARGIALDNTAAQNFNLPMDSDSDFVCCSLAGGGRIATAIPSPPAPADANQVVEFAPAIVVQITDQSSGKTWFNMPTPAALVAGAGGFPYLLTSPRVVKPKTTLTVSAQGVVPGTVYADFFFALHGAKVYYA